MLLLSAVNAILFLAYFLLRFLASVLLFSILLIGIQYLTTTIYDFEEPVPFSGKKWLNPYQSLGDERIKANFHAHSCAWKSLTYGNSTPENMRRNYKEKGYDIAAISNYFSLDTTGKQNDPLYIPVYEHGLNVFKSHCLVLNPQNISYCDYFLFQSTSHQQKVIEQIKAQKGIVVLAHPEFNNGRSMNDMKYLQHYDLIEVLNHFRISEEHWDMALSNGKLAYLLANDDSHSTDADEMARVWTVIFSPERTKNQVLNSLLQGKAVGVYTEYNECENDFVSCDLRNDSVYVKFALPADTILFIGQGGRIKQKVVNEDHAVYKLRKEDTYIRVVAKNRESRIYLNPIVRYDANSNEPLLASMQVPKENKLQTWLFRVCDIGFLYFPLRGIWLLWRPKKRKRRTPRIHFSKRRILLQP